MNGGCARCEVRMRLKTDKRDTPGTRVHAGRGLCSTCYSRLRVNGGLDQYPLAVRPGGARPVTCVSVLEDFLWATGCLCRCHLGGFTHEPGLGCHCGGPRVVADRFGMSSATLAKALYRAKLRLSSVAA